MKVSQISDFLANFAGHSRFYRQFCFTFSYGGIVYDLNDFHTIDEIRHYFFFQEKDSSASLNNETFSLERQSLLDELVSLKEEQKDFKRMLEVAQEQKREAMERVDEMEVNAQVGFNIVDTFVYYQAFPINLG